MELINEKPLAEKISTDEASVAVLSAPKKINYEEFTFRPLSSGEVLVKIKGCGICASNIPVWEGRPWFDYPMSAGAPGHEGWGVIEDVGKDVTALHIGQDVSILAGDAFATHVICDTSKVVPIPKEISNKPFPGEPLGCAMNVFERSDIKEGQTIAILGVGFLGSVLIQLAKNAGAQVIAVSRRESSKNLAAEMGADKVFDWQDKDELWQYLKSENEDGCERVIECVGNQKALDLASEIVATRGKLIIAGYHQEDLRHINMQVWNWKGIDVINAHERDQDKYISGIKKAIKALKNNEIKIDRLLTHKFHYSQLAEALETLTQYPEGFTKAYIQNGSNS